MIPNTAALRWLDQRRAWLFEDLARGLIPGYLYVTLWPPVYQGA